MTFPDPGPDTMQALLAGVKALLVPPLDALDLGFNVYDDEPAGPSVPCCIVHDDEDAITYATQGFEDDAEDEYGIVALFATGPLDSPDATKLARRLISRHGPLYRVLEGADVDGEGSILTVVKARLGVVEIGSGRFRSASIHCTTLSS